MGFFKNLFSAKTGKQRYKNFPEIPITNIPLPITKQRSFSAGKLALHRKLGKVSQARPKRVAELWQGTLQNRPQLFGIIAPGEENKKWLSERLGGAGLRETAWETVTSKRPLPNFGSNFSYLGFRFTIDTRYQLRYCCYNDERQEIWEAYDKTLKKQVACIVLKPICELKLEGTFRPRKFQDPQLLMAKSNADFLNVSFEGFCKIAGPFANYRYKYPQIFYVITETLPVIAPLVDHLGKRRFQVNEAISILYQAGRILQCMHSDGWIHGQVCPQNLWLHDEKKKPNLYLNGASAVHLEEHARSTIFTGLHNSLHDNLFPYMAPEQLTSQRPTAKIDQFSLALTIYHLLSNKNPLSAPNSRETQTKIQNCNIRPLHKVSKKIPRWFSKIIERMLAPAPKNRFSSLMRMLEELAQQYEEAQIGGHENEDETNAKTVVAKDVPAIVKNKDKPTEQEKDNIYATGEEIIASADTIINIPMPKIKPPLTAKETEFEEIIVSESADEKAVDKQGVSCYIQCHPFHPFRLQKNKEFRIGRARKNQLILSSEDVSRFHAIIVWKEKGYIIKDEGSSNGVMVNDNYVAQRLLRHNDKISIGANSMFYREIKRGRLPKGGSKEIIKQRTRQLPMMDKTMFDTTSTFSGDLAQISLWQVLQMLAADEKTGALLLSNGEETKIFFVDGMVVHCEKAKMKGHDAFYSILQVQQGRFKFDADLASAEITMSDFVESLLLEGARRFDEQQR